MARMGHDSMAAALIYQHASAHADRAIAAAMDARYESLWTDPSTPSTPRPAPENEREQP
jgi:hypothetical protein